MQLVSGRRYRLIKNDFPDTTDGVFQVSEQARLIFIPDGYPFSFDVTSNGIVPGVGRLVDLDPDDVLKGAPEAPKTLRPIFGHDPEEFARLRRVFSEGWDFSWGAR